MMKRYLAFLFISILSMSSAFAQISGPGVGGGSSGGGITGPGTTSVGNIATWNSTTGASLSDSGIYAGSNSFVGGTSSAFTITAGVGQQINIGGNGAAFYRFTASGNFAPITSNTGNIGIAGAAWFTTAAVQTLDLEGSSTGYDIIQSGNAGTGTWTYKTPPATGTGSDTFVTLAATNAYTGPNSFAGAASGSAANTTTIMGGSVAPTMGANAGFLTVGGLFAAPSITTGGQGTVSLSAANGLQIEGKGSTGDVSILDSAGAVALYVRTGTQNVQVQGSLYLVGNLFGSGGHIIATNTAPTFTNAAIGVANGSFAFSFVPTASASSVTVTLPAATTGWACQFTDLTTPTTVPKATATTTTAVTVAPYGWTTGTVGTFGTADTVQAICFAY